MNERLDPTGRFSDRVDAYEGARPGYPAALYDEILRPLHPRGVIAELGSGTGIFARELLRRGFLVYGVEPNQAMRQAAERALSECSRFVSVAGTAERSGLPASSIDLVVTAQAFHWFDFDRTRTEVERILRPRGTMAWIWNTRRTSGSAFAEDLERFLEHWGTDYLRIRERYRVRERLDEFLPGERLRRRAFENHQLLDRAGFRARILSASYIPAAEHPAHEEMLAALDVLFDLHQRDTRVSLEMDAEVFWSRRP